MKTTIEFRGWVFAVDLDRTSEAYTSSGRGGAELCSCAYCRNFIMQRHSELPTELKGFLDSVGIDPSKEAEIWEAGPLEAGYSFNAGWWHFIGEVKTAGSEPIELEAQPTGRAMDWSVLFCPGQRDLKLEALPDEPLVQVEFSVMLPWVLDEPYPGQ